MSRPVPTPRRACRRYNACGTICRNTTVRADGWCGECDGFTTPKPATPAQAPRPRKLDDTWVQADTITLNPEDLRDLSVTKTAINAYATRHQCRPEEAETQLRSMTEDFVLDDATDIRRASNGGAWSLWNDGYVLVLSPDVGAVIGYSTNHAERTWAQVKAGVRSRLSTKNRARKRGPSGSRVPVWFRDLESNAGLQVPCTFNAAKLYVHLTDGCHMHQDAAAGYMLAIARRVNAALAAWDGSDGRHSLPDPEDPTLSWLLAKDKGEEPFIASVSCTPTKEQE